MRAPINGLQRRAFQARFIEQEVHGNDARSARASSGGFAAAGIVSRQCGVRPGAHIDGEARLRLRQASRGDDFDAQPRVKGLTLMVNSIYHGNRFEDLWLDK